MVGRSGSERVRICFNLERILFSTNGKIKYCQSVSLPRPLGELAAVSRPGVLKALRGTNTQDAGQWGNHSSRPPGEVNTRDEHVEAAAGAGAW